MIVVSQTKNSSLLFPVVMCVGFGDWGIIPTRLQCGFLRDKYGGLMILRLYYKYILYSFLSRKYDKYIKRPFLNSRPQFISKS